MKALGDILSVIRDHADRRAANRSSWARQPHVIVHESDTVTAR